MDTDEHPDGRDTQTKVCEKEQRASTIPAPPRVQQLRSSPNPNTFQIFMEASSCRHD